MLGILGQFFNQAYIGLSMDPQYASTAALAKSYVVDVTNWITTKGVQPSTRGLWYGVGAGVCEAPNPTEPSCASPDAIQSRDLTPETLGTLAAGYSYNPSPALRARIDDLYSAVYAKYPTDPGYDGLYSTGIEGYYISTQNPKWQGFFFGMGRNAAWPSARQGGLGPEQPVMAYIDMSLNGAAELQLTVIDPTGVKRSPVTCTATPCAVTVNRTLGNALVQPKYLAADGTVLEIGETLIVPVN
jgi:hypothetical protein